LDIPFFGQSSEERLDRIGRHHQTASLLNPDTNVSRYEITLGEARGGVSDEWFE
jgi:hypothetical protein